MEQVSRKQAIEQLWKIGRIRDMVLHRGQLDVLNRFENSSGRIFTLNCARRFGKSTTLVCLAIETCIRHPGVQVRYVSQTGDAVRKIVTPLFKQLLTSCPDYLRPSFRSQQKMWVFPNGSEIYIAGADNGRAENLRGTGMHLGLFDEAGFVGDLKYILNDILLPQTLTTGGRIVLASTPSKSPDHPYKDYVDSCKLTGDYYHATIYDNPLINAKTISEIAQASGGYDSDTFRREYMAEFLIDHSYAVVPEWSREVQEECVQAVERPQRYDAYVGMDFGFMDNTGILFGYWDWVNARLVIEQEVLVSRKTTREVAEIIKAKEEQLWGSNPPVHLTRVADTDKTRILDFATEHHLAFSEPLKPNKESTINALRMFIAAGKLVIHPQCERLIQQLAGAVWNKNRTQFERNDVHGHYDLVDALAYIIPNINRNRNYAPNKYAGLSRQHWYIPNQPPADEGIYSIRRWFKL